MSEELTKVKHAEKADELVNYKQITLDGDVTGEIEAKQDGTQGFNGSEDVKITTTITGGDISKTTIEITELSGVDEEEIQSKETTGKLLYKIKNKFEEIEKGLENKLGKIDAATSAEKLSKGKNISLVGNVEGSVEFDGSDDVKIETEIIGGDIKDTTVSFTESEIKEEIQSGESTGTIIGKIKKWFRDLQEQVNNKLGKNDKAKDSYLLDGKKLSNIQAYCFYNNKDVGIKNTGIIINTDIDKKEDVMIFISIRGNGYGSLCPIDTKVQVYNYVTKTGESYYNPSQLNSGLNIPAIIMFVNKDNKFSFYLKKNHWFESHWIEVYTCYVNVGNPVVNRVTTVDFAEEPPKNMARMLTFDVIETVKKYQNQ